MVAVLGLVAASLAMVWPGVVAVVCVAGLVLAAAIGSGVRATRERRSRAGRRKSDLVVASLSSPWHVLRGALLSAVSLGLGLLAGVGIWWVAGLVAGAAVDPLGGPGGLGARAESLAVGLAFVATLVVAWLVPTSRRAQEGARSVLALLAAGSAMSTLVVVVGVVVALVALAVVASGATAPDWSPFGGSA